MVETTKYTPLVVYREYLVVPITVLNLVMIDALVSIILRVGGPRMPQTNPRWRTAATDILKILQIAKSPQRIDRF